MLQNTVRRLSMIKCRPPIILGNSKNYKIIEKQISSLNIDYKIIIEPCSKNTAPAITAALINCNPSDFALILSQII